MKQTTRWWRLITVAAVFGLLVGVAQWTFVPAKYSATAAAFVSPASRFATESDPFAGSPFVLQRIDSYAALAKSPPVLEAVVRNLGISRTVDELRGEVTSTNPPQTVMLSVVVVDKSPELAAAIANAVVAQQSSAIESLEGQADSKNSSPLRVTPVETATPSATRGRAAALARSALLGLGSGLVIVAAGAMLHCAGRGRFLRADRTLEGSVP